MCPKDINNQRLILQAAEAEFLEKGYDKARTTEIAKRAGVNHAMLHYYYQSKEKLFHVVFEEKSRTMHDILLFKLDEDLPFLEKIKAQIEHHFDYIAQHAEIPGFIISEILHSETLREQFIRSTEDHAKDVFAHWKKEIDKEVENGRIRYIEPYDLVYSMVTLNCCFFLIHPLLSAFTGEEAEALREERKKMNTEIILSRLRI
ncbi:MAG: TetR/AcrR family transcriptional regulator [Rikenellaceae bacterium]|nr:TetR/AcrR family transcriptional regulator [Rikenellaceae bacterium]